MERGMATGWSIPMLRDFPTVIQRDFPMGWLMERGMATDSPIQKLKAILMETLRERARVRDWCFQKWMERLRERAMVKGKRFQK